MSRPLIRVLAFGTLTATTPLHAAEDPGIALPPVPRALLLAASDQPARIRHVSAESSGEDRSDGVDPPGCHPVSRTQDGPRLPRHHGHRRGRHRPPEPHRHPLRRAAGAHRRLGHDPGRRQCRLRRDRERGAGEPLHHRGGGHGNCHLVDAGTAPHPAAGGAPGAHRRPRAHRGRCCRAQGDRRAG